LPNFTFENFVPPTKGLAPISTDANNTFTNPGWPSYGTGKTHLAAAEARELILQGKKVEFVYTPALLFRVRKAFQEGASEDEYSRVFHYSEEVPYLMLDDIGVEKTTEWARQTLDVIFYERDSHDLSTVITSNLSPDEIAEKIDPRISSRKKGGP
jgi:DNA replication protein DnaC